MEFADIALAKFLQTIPELGPLILTFQDVTEELQDDTGIMVGVFVLRIGSELYYVPVVSKNDNVYPIDSIFFDSKKKFFPLTKKTINLVLNSAQLDPGQAQKIPTSVVGNPSVFEIINPPRTGKYVYSSSSRLIDFLSSMPDYLKKFTFEKIAAEKSVYDSLDTAFGLKAIFDVLRPAPGSLAAKTNQAPISVVTEASPALSPDGVSSILNDGYHIVGKQPTRRVAVTVEDFHTDGLYREVSDVDGDNDYVISLNNGTTREAYIPHMRSFGGSARGRSLALFTNGDYALSDSFIAVGDTPDRKVVLTRLFDYKPPVLLRDVYNGDTIALCTSDGEVLGPFNVRNVMLNSYGIEISVSDYSNYNIRQINGFRNFARSAECQDGSLYVPYNIAVLKLADNITMDLESSVQSAQRRREISAMQFLGSEMNLGYDGVEFSINGSPIGAEPKVMEILVVKEGIEPDAARNFVKQAKVTKLTKIYMTKQATSTDYNPAETPQYGILPESNWDVSPNGAFLPNLQKSLALGDSQVTESTIISELLQCPDMFEQIGEYMPEIEEAIDKLGRILFMARVHIGKLSETNDADNLFSFLASLKTIYRLLGDNYVKLNELVRVSANSENMQIETRDE
jgi:hypothetical protein